MENNVEKVNTYWGSDSGKKDIQTSSRKGWMKKNLQLQMLDTFYINQLEIISFYGK